MEKPNRELKAVICSNIPEQLNKRKTLHDHFSKFGQVDSISCSKLNKYAVVQFTTSAAARAAKEKGGLIDEAHPPIEIYFSGKSSGAGGPKKDRSPGGLLKRLSTSSAEEKTRPKTRLATNFLQNSIRAYLSPPSTSDTESQRSEPDVTMPEKKRSTRPRLIRSSFTFSSPSASSVTLPVVSQNDPPTDFQEPVSDAVPNISSKKQPFTFDSNESREKSPARNFLADESASTSSKSMEIQKSSSDNSELKELFSKRAVTAEDRYRVLDARDKFLRQKNPKVKVRVEFAVKLVGTCQDMCPEKERYMREVQRQLSNYECLHSTGDSEVDHQKAIKQYSRSSADQEEPLPHELRPTSTLDMTMSFLLHNIVNRSENPTENLMEWYTFMWDRTRSIRKDITQQELCDLKAVALMEKCTRFHIHCSSRLCELDLHAFDPKLNDENLMKCLQSLEHMYADLHVKGVQCPREPEFRSYQILMNLNEGDILWEIQQKPDWVLRSVEVRHALKIHLALFQKNFVAFFRLVQQSSYMTSCLLHRYFFQVRTFALRRLIRAHCALPKLETTMPVGIAQRLLGFGPDEENLFTNFCETHGIICDLLGRTMTMSRRSLLYPESPTIHREYFLVDSKLQMSVAESINGEPLGLNPAISYVPQSSFDKEGFLLKSDSVFSKIGNLSSNKVATQKPLFSEQNLIPSNRPTKSIFEKRPEISAGITKRDVGFELSGQKTFPSIFGPPIPSTVGTSKTSSSLGISAPNVFGPALESSGTKSVFGTASIFGGSPSAPEPNLTNIASTIFSTTKPESQEKPYGLFSPILGANVSPVISEPLVDGQFEHNYTKDLLLTVVGSVVAEELVGIVKSTMLQIHHLKEEEKAKAMWQSAENSITDMILSQVQNQVTSQIVKEVCIREFEDYQLFQLISRDIEIVIRESILKELITSICLENYNAALQDRERKITKGIEILKNVQVSIWLQRWKYRACEKKQDRLRRVEKRKSDIENFPPSLSCSLSPATILESWCMIKTPNLNISKITSGVSSINLIQRSEELRSLCTTHFENTTPSELKFITEPLCKRLWSETSKPPFLAPIQLPPVMFNIVLLSQVERKESLATWVWDGFRKESSPTSDKNIRYKNLDIDDKDYFLTLQKYSLLPAELGRSISSNTCGIVLFLETEEINLDILRFYLSRPISLVVINLSSMTHSDIRKNIWNTFEDNGLIQRLKIFRGYQELLGNIPVIADCLNWLGLNLPFVIPMKPSLAFPSLISLARFLISQVFPIVAANSFCIRALLQAHDTTMSYLITLVESAKTIGYRNEWPDIATVQVSESVPHLKPLLPPNNWRTDPDNSQLQSAVELLRIKFPDSLFEYSHHLEEFTPGKISCLITDYVRSICWENTSSLDLMHMSEDLKNQISQCNLTAIWKDLVHMSQQYRLNCLEQAMGSVQVCVSVSELVRLTHGVPIIDDCRSCCDERTLSVRRKRHLDLESPNPTPSKKNARGQQNSILSEIYEFINEVRSEKSCLQFQESDAIEIT